MRPDKPHAVHTVPHYMKPPLLASLSFRGGLTTGCAGEVEAGQARSQVFGFVQGALAHRPHGLLSAGHSSLTLAQAVDGPSAAMRAQVGLRVPCAPAMSFLHGLARRQPMQCMPVVLFLHLHACMPSYASCQMQVLMPKQPSNNSFSTAGCPSCCQEEASWVQTCARSHCCIPGRSHRAQHKPAVVLA